MWSKMTKILLHIGTHKTGSTAIQSFCYKNSMALIQQGILYPESYTKWGGHHQIPWHLGVTHPYKDEDITFDQIMLYLKQQIAIYQPRQVILSSEDFEFLPLPALKRLKETLDDYPIEILIYLRRQDNYLISEYKQHVRMEVTQFSGTLFDFVLKYDFEPRFNYKYITDKWSEVFGKNSLIVRPFEKQQLKDGDVVEDFISTINIERTENIQSVESSESNIGLSNMATLLLSKLNAYDISNRGRLIELLRDLDFPDIDLISSKARKEILSRFEASNSDIAKQYLGRSNGQLYFDDLQVDKLSLPVEHQLIDSLLKLAVNLYQQNDALSLTTI